MTKGKRMAYWRGERPVYQKVLTDTIFLVCAIKFFLFSIYKSQIDISSEVNQ